MRIDEGGGVAMQGWGGFQNVGWRAAAATEDCGVGDKHRHADSPKSFRIPSDQSPKHEICFEMNYSACITTTDIDW